MTGKVTALFLSLALAPWPYSYRSMSQSLSFSSLMQDSLARAHRLILPSLPFAFGFSAAMGVFVWGANLLPDDGNGFLIFCALFLALLFAHSVFSVAMYRAALSIRPRLVPTAWKLTLAWLLMGVIAAIGASMITLFFALIGSSLGVGSSENVNNIGDMTTQMREGGTFWPLFILFLATLFGVFWFATRMTVFAAATSARGTVHVLRTWAWTKGQFLPLGGAMMLFVAVPLVALIYVGGLVSTALVGTDPTPIQAGLAGSVSMLILLPSAWLGHGFAASAYAQLAPTETR